ncbi:LemA family protein [Proteus mirabilis]|uniref:LemA family protein n=1 Tax=Proteus mirabilis TaxID=584 RepID=UPI0029C0DBF1|nr:LemA family protein [Proteus mirabilis]MDX4948933.1 LemA family protein [Proteus mirabilis]
MRKLVVGLVLILIIIFVVLINAYNKIQKNDELVTAAASELLNQYQRRLDLIPNLVNTVKGYSNYESQVLQDVVKARASVGQINVNTRLFENSTLATSYQKAQDDLGKSLSRLLAISERYPDLKANTLYQDLMVQLEGTENRISVARGRYIEAVRHYNTQIRQFPYNFIAIVMGYDKKVNFTVDSEQKIKVTPVVDFAS